MTTNNDIEISTYVSILKRATGEKKSAYTFSKTYPAYIILVLALLLSFFIWNIFENKVETDRKTSFDKATSSVITRMEKQYDSHLQIVQSIRGLYNNMVQVVRDYFLLYASIPTKTYPSLLSILYAVNVDNANMGEYIYYTRSQGYFYYEISPPGVRQNYIPIQFLVPEERNSAWSGYDLKSNPIIYSAIQKAVQKNELTATPVFSLRKDTLEFVIISPIIKKGANAIFQKRGDEFEALVALEVNAPVFFERALEEHSPTDSLIMFECFNESGGVKERIFASSNIALAKKGDKPAFTETQKIHIADKNIDIKFSTVPGFDDTFSKYQPKILLGITILLSFFVFGFTMTSITSKAHAVDLAERMTRSQRRIVESSQDIIAVMDIDGKWKSMNPAAKQILDYQPEDLIGQNIEMFFANSADYDKKLWYKDEAEEFINRTTVLMKTKAGALKWINWSFSFSHIENLVYCIGRDVTLEKNAEDEAHLRAKQTQLAEQFTREASEFKSFFMTKLSHQLRNWLTSIIGYMELLDNKEYETQEEHDFYIQIVLQSSEELINFVSDMVEVAQKNSDSTFNKLTTVSFEKMVKELKLDFAKEVHNKITLELGTQGKRSSTVVADFRLLKNAFEGLCKALTQGNDMTSIHIEASENPYENITEIQMLTSPNPIVSDIIKIYQDNINNLIEALRYDKNDIMLQFAVAASNFRMMNGTISFSSLGPDDGNLIQINLPYNETANAQKALYS